MKGLTSYGRLSVLIILWLYGVLTSGSLMPVIVTFPVFLVIAFSVAKISEPNFTSGDMFWLCCLFFFVIAPCQAINEYKFESGPARGVPYELRDFIGAALIVFIALFVYAVFSRKRKPLSPQPLSLSLNLSPGKALIVIVIALIGFVGYVYFSGGIGNVMLPRREKIRDDVSFLSVLFLSLQAVAVAIIAVGASSGALKRQGVSPLISWPILSVLFALLLVCVNPLNSPRFFVIASWVPILLGMVGTSIGYRPIYAVIVLGVLVLMPLASITSRSGLSGLDSFSDTVYATDTYRLKDIDVFDTLVHCVSMMDGQKFYMGDNSLAIILFFVPRSIWEGKPIVGGLLVGEDLYARGLAGTPNLSFFPAGDLYMDFGYVGVIIGAMLLATIARFFSRTSLLGYGGRDLGALFLLGSLPILIRGPLGAVVGYYACLLFSLFFFRLIFRLGFGPVRAGLSK